MANELSNDIVIDIDDEFAYIDTILIETSDSEEETLNCYEVLTENEQMSMYIDELLSCDLEVDHPNFNNDFSNGCLNGLPRLGEEIRIDYIFEGL